jgi:hypothetical protein
MAKYVLYTLAILFVVAWAVSFFALHVAAPYVHLLLVLAAFAIVIRLMTDARREPV